MRNPLKKRLFSAWQSTISIDYANRRINSERSLQAAFCARLAGPLNEVSQFLVIEPYLGLTRGGRVHPDVLVCSARRVLAVIELKYQPRTAPSFRHDVEKLDAIAMSKESLQLDQQRYLGPTRPVPPFAFSRHTLLVWAGVYRGGGSESEPIAIHTPPSLAKCFYSLHAVTSPDRPPRLIATAS